MLSPNSIHKTIFDIKAQTKNIKTADLLKLPIVQKILSTEKRQNDCNRDKDKRNDSDGSIDIKKSQARISEKTKLKIVHEFYLRNSCRSLISEKLFLSYSSVCRVIREYASDFKVFNVMFKSWYYLFIRKTSDF